MSVMYNLYFPLKLSLQFPRWRTRSTDNNATSAVADKIAEEKEDDERQIEVGERDRDRRRGGRG
jgi:hypothetical protein